MGKLFNDRQINAIGNGFWKIAELLFAGGFVAGVMMDNVPAFKVIIAFVLAAVFAFIGFIYDGIIGDK